MASVPKPSHELGVPQSAAEILAEEFPHLCNHTAMLVGRPFRLLWDPTSRTASTDCRAHVRMSPHFFLTGRKKEGYGTAYHEAGHIRSSPYGAELIGRAQQEGGPVLGHLMNIILDRKDDLQTAEAAPGFAETLRSRLTYVCTMTVDEALQRRRPDLNPEQRAVAVRNWKPSDPYEDFFYAAKWHKQPRTKQGARAMKHLTATQLATATPEHLFWKAERIREILGEPTSKPGDEEKRQKAEMRFVELQLIAANAEHGTEPLSPALRAKLEQLIQQYMAGGRTSGLRRLVAILSTQGISFPGPVSTGKAAKVPLKKLPSGAEYAGAYRDLLAEVADEAGALARRLRALDTPSEFTIFGQDEGDLDLSEAGRIALGLPGVYSETVLERNLDLELVLALDISGSMEGAKLRKLKQIATVFTEAVLSLEDNVSSRLWAYNNEAILDLGPASRNSAFTALKAAGYNSDTHMLVRAGEALARSPRPRKVLIVVTDSGPDSVTEARALSEQLMSRGVVVIHLLTDVHGTPDIYPVELPYSSIDECLREFGELIETVVRHTR